MVFHAAGWLLTPIATILAASLGATVGALIAQRASPTTGVIVALIGGLVGASLGLWVWLRFLRGSPELRDVLAVTPEGVPTEEAIAEVLGDDPPADTERSTT
jgi:uncharacterized membrane protein YeaQ/YmgE (transglycosylase-associated protein family)